MGGVQIYGDSVLHMGASKCMGAYGNSISLTNHAFFVLCMYRGHPNIIIPYRGHPNMGVPNIQGHPRYGVSKHMGASKHTEGCPNIWGMSKHTGGIKHMQGIQIYGGVQTYRGHSCMPFYPTKWVLSLVIEYLWYLHWYYFIIYFMQRYNVYNTIA